MPDDVRYISSPELGEILGLTDPEVCRLARAGILPRIPRERGRGFLYPLVGCLRAYLKHRNSQSVKDREAYLREKARTEKARAEKLELENALREERQVNIEEVAREMREQRIQGNTRRTALRPGLNGRRDQVISGRGEDAISSSWLVSTNRDDSRVVGKTDATWKQLAKR